VTIVRCRNRLGIGRFPGRLRIRRPSGWLGIGGSRRRLCIRRSCRGLRVGRPGRWFGGRRRRQNGRQLRRWSCGTLDAENVCAVDCGGYQGYAPGKQGGENKFFHNIR
jgi:hypothetical protein